MHDSSRVLKLTTTGETSLSDILFGLQYPFQPLAVNLTVPLTMNFFFFLQFIYPRWSLVSIYSFNFTWCYTIRWRQTAFFFESIIIQSIRSTTLIQERKLLNKSLNHSFNRFVQTIWILFLSERHAWFRTVTVLFVWITKRHDRHPIKLLSFCMWKNKSFVQIRSTKPFGKIPRSGVQLLPLRFWSAHLWQRICALKVTITFFLLISSR